MVFEESNIKDWEEIAKFIADEMEEKELLEFQEKINFSDYNKKLVQQVKIDWKEMKNYKNNQVFNADSAWDKLHAKFEQDGLLSDIKPSVKRNNFQIMYKIAAIFILGILLTSIFYYLSKDNSQAGWKVADTYQKKENSKVLLADGSVVYLNANSKLFYPEKFTEKNRTVEFEGDAFFEIAKNPERPFIIRAKGAEIKVLGTSFNVNTNLVSKDVEVLVETGKVKFTSLENQKESVTLVHGQLGTLQNKRVFATENSDKNYLSWKTKCFDFREGIRLDNAIEILNRAYHANIVCKDPQVCNKLLNSAFNKEDSLDKIIKIICFNWSLKAIPNENGEIVLAVK